MNRAFPDVLDFASPKRLSLNSLPCHRKGEFFFYLLLKELSGGLTFFGIVT